MKIPILKKKVFVLLVDIEDFDYIQKSMENYLKNLLIFIINFISKIKRWTL